MNAQTALVTALLGQPRDAAEALYAALLMAKRRAEIAACLPALATALGSRFAPAFAAWWSASAHDHADFRTALVEAGTAMQRWLPAPLPDAVIIELSAHEVARRGPLLVVRRVRLGRRAWLRLTPGGRLRVFDLPGG